MDGNQMHDWTLRSIEVSWKSGDVRLHLVSGPDAINWLTARDVVMLVIPRRQEWGPSESILNSTGPEPHADGQRMEIVMQSGDSIQIIARDFSLT